MKRNKIGWLMLAFGVFGLLSSAEFARSSVNSDTKRAATRAQGPQ